MTYPALHWMVMHSANCSWVLADTTPQGDGVTEFAIQIDHHWDTGAPTEYIVFEGENEIGRFASAEEAKAFGMATYALEDSE